MDRLTAVRYRARRSRTLRGAYRIARDVVDRVSGFGVIHPDGPGVLGLIDVGSVGRLPSPWHKRSELLRNVLKFEPRDSPSEKPGVITIDVALWSELGTRPFYVYADSAGHGSSLFKPNDSYVRANFDNLRHLGPRSLAESWFKRATVDHVENIACTTLDTVLADRLENYQVLKIDAQGAEMPILHGATNYLSSGDCLALHLELYRLPLYEGIALRPEVEEFLDGIGFSLAKEYPAHGTFNSQNDCVFLHRGAKGSLIDAIRNAYEL